MANTYLTRTTGSPTNSYKCTFSAWFKKGNTGGNNKELISEYTDSNNRTYIGFNASDQFQFGSYQSSSWVNDFYFSRIFRDVSAFYNFVIAIDTTLSTASDRVKIYINGVLETSVAGSPTYFSQNSSVALNSASKSLQIGAINGSNNFDGSMSHVHFIDGTAYDASYFGSTDSTTGEWKINTSPSVTYGNNGFFILKDGNTITDSSPNSNNFSLGGGTLTKTEDSPSNVFATMNPLDNYFGNAAFLYGNTSVDLPAANETYNTSTLGFASLNGGKYYCEVKVSDASDYTLIGIASRGPITTNETFNNNGTGNGYAYDSQAGIIRTGGGTISGWSGSSYTTGDIIGVAVDTDSQKLYFSKNGVWQNSANPSSGTGSAAITSSPSSGTGIFLFAGGNRHNDNSVLEYNFGNGYFGTTAVSSAGTNASGIGIFEYDVPTGFTALSTKGLNL